VCSSYLKAIHKLKSFYRIAATGTPLMNKPIDLYNVLKWVGAERSSFYAFKNQYCVMGGFGGYEYLGPKNGEELSKKLNGVMLRRKKSEVLDLPPKIRSVEYVEMSEKQKLLYKEVKMSIEANLDEIKLNPNPLTTLIRLRQVTSAPAILSKTITDSAKIDRLKDIIEELAENGQKAIVFSEWTEVTTRVRDALKDFNPAYITGEGNTDVEEEKERFTNDPKCSVIIGTRSKLGTGHTLTAASTVIFIDKPWTRADEEQAEDRAHRIGTTGTVNCITLVCKDTIDERIEEILEGKGDLADALVDGDLKKLTRLQFFEHLLS
jgi:SNF2 family DNA or RNA helicase